jgi:hypothetical protein
MGVRESFSAAFTRDDNKLAAQLLEGQSPRLAEFRDALLDEQSTLTGRFSRPSTPKPRQNALLAESTSERDLGDVLAGRTAAVKSQKTNYWSVSERLNAIRLALREAEDLAFEVADQSDESLRPRLERIWAQLPGISDELRYRDE